MPKFINWTKKKNASQPIYEHAPQNHQIKSHTPTMGGVIFVFCAIFASLLCIKFDNLFALMGLLCLISFCFIGVIDDLGKILKKIIIQV